MLVKLKFYSFEAYTIGSSLIKTSYGSWVKDDLEFKSKEGSYLGISQQDNEILRQVNLICFQLTINSKSLWIVSVSTGLE